MSLVQNERTKLLATALNNVSVATIVTGIIAPIVGFLSGTHRTRKAQGMTELQIYLLVAPLELLAIGAGAAWWWVATH